MDKSMGVHSMNRAAYLGGAGAIGFVWWAMLSISWGVGSHFLKPSLPMLLGFVLGAITLAWLFRRLITGSESRLGTLFSYTVIPFLGGMFTVIWMYAADFSIRALGGQPTTSPYSTSAPVLVIGMFYGPAVVFLNRWFVVLPLALLSQVAMHYLGRRYLGAQSEFKGMFGTQDLEPVRGVGG